MCVGEVVLANDLLGVVTGIEDTTHITVTDKKGESHVVKKEACTSILAPCQTALMFYHKLRGRINGSN